MSKYKCAVRVLGNDVDGYRVQYTYNHFRLFPFLTYWFNHDIPFKVENSYTTKYLPIVDDIEVAKAAALEKYERLVEYEREEIEKKAARKKVKKVRWIYV